MKRLLLLLALGLAACSAKAPEGWIGYVEGEDALIAPPQPGWVTSLAVKRGDQVKTGDLLFTLDDTKERAARDNAEAAIMSADAANMKAQADVAQTSKELARQRGLTRSNATTERDLEAAQAAAESARSQLDAADAQRMQAEAALTTAEWNLSERSVHARVNGRVEDIYFRPGEYAEAGAPVISLLPPQNVYIRFFVPEAALATLMLDDHVNVGCDGCPTDLTATITFIAQQAEFAPPVIYSVRNRSRLVFKAEARFGPDQPAGAGLRPGLPVDVTPVTRRAAP